MTIDGGEPSVSHGVTPADAEKHSASRANRDGSKRNRLGCLNCRRRRRKCNEQRPTCQTCLRKEETCRWPSRYLFKDGKALTLNASHPSMRRASETHSRGQNFAILDVTDDIIQEYNGFPDQRRASAGSVRTVSPAEGPVHRGDIGAPSAEPFSNETLSALPLDALNCSQITGLETNGRSSVWTEPSPDLQAPLGFVLPPHHQRMGSTDYTLSEDLSANGAGSSFPRSPSATSRRDSVLSFSISQAMADRHWPDILHSNRRRTSGHDTNTRTEVATEGLLSLRYQPVLVNHSAEFAGRPIPCGVDFSPPQEEMLLSTYVSPESPDGIFLPGSTYQELHTNLRHHLITTARANSMFAMENADGSDSYMVDLDNGMKENSRTPGKDTEILPTTSPNSIELIPSQEFILWKNYIVEISPWLDKFDNESHFQNKVPVLASHYEHLKCSILATSARQMERRDPSQPSSGSLALYQKAIHLLLPDIVTKNSGVIASCVILCVLEMMSCNPKEWRRHLDGCAVLLNLADVHGFVGGLNQALFWCYARMDVCGGLISEETTNIPIEKWTSHTNIAEADALFNRANLPFDMYANYALFLLARVLRLLFCPSNRRHRTRPTTNNVEALENWQALFEALHNWRQNRPDELLPVMTVPLIKKGNESPFPTVLFGAIPAISSNQLYHTAAILMLQNRPRDVRLEKDSKSIIWHARQICGIAESNTHHGSWINALQPLYIAGKVMSHPSEHSKVLEILDTIERETGWGTKWRADDLRAVWGDDDD